MAMPVLTVCKMALVVSILVALELPGLVKISAIRPIINNEMTIAGHGPVFFSSALL